MAKSIVTVGFEVPGQQEIYEPMKSDISLLDHDIAVFDPVIFDFYGFSYDDYQGKPCLDDTYSFRLKEKLSHWRREVLEAVRAGKSVFVL